MGATHYLGHEEKRRCGDYKVTVNQVAKVDTHSLPKIDGILSSFGGGMSFTTLNLSHT